MNNNIILKCSNVSKCFHDANKEVKVLKNINLTIHAKELTAIVGVSGSGKSTLLHILAGLDNPTTGSVSICDHNIAKLSDTKRAKLRNSQIGFVYQFHHLLPEFSVLENIAMPLLLNSKIPRTNIKKLTLAMADEMGLTSRINHKPAELSGGERQRVAIARALVNKPKLVFMDEPTGNLDNTTATKIQQVITNLAKYNDAAFVIVTHDLEFAQHMHTLWQLEQGSINKKF